MSTPVALQGLELIMCDMFRPGGHVQQSTACVSDVMIPCQAAEHQAAPFRQGRHPFGPRVKMTYRHDTAFAGNSLLAAGAGACAALRAGLALNMSSM